MSGFPIHVTAAWLGHGIAISQPPYLQVPDMLIEEAAGLHAPSELQNALHHRTAPTRTKRQLALPAPNGQFGSAA